MSVLQIIYGYQPIFKKKAEYVEEVNDEVRTIVSDMFDTLYYEEAVGLGANMVGILKRIVVVDLFENGQKNPICLINPKIISKSKEMQSFQEASLSFPGITAEISRPTSIVVEYVEVKDGKKKEISATGFLSSVIQHEMDYLDGVTIFDHCSSMKKEMMLKKLEKYMKLNPPHVHSHNCRH